MPATSQITLDMCLDELKRIQAVMEKSYPQLVKDQKLNPWTRDHRLAVMRKMVNWMEDAKAKNEFPDILKLINP